MINRITHRALRRVCIIAAAIITVSCATAPSGPQAASAVSRQGPDAESRKAIYMAHLREAGYTPRITDDGYIAFSWEGLNYLIYVDDTDPAFCFLQIPIIKYLDTDEERRRGAEAVSAANRGTKVAKAYFVSPGDRVAVSIGTELYIENPEHFAVLLSRMMSAANTARRSFDSNF